jgi:hypothetical protein
VETWETPLDGANGTQAGSLLLTASLERPIFFQLQLPLWIGNDLYFINIIKTIVFIFSSKILSGDVVVLSCSNWPALPKACLSHRDLHPD